MRGSKISQRSPLSKAQRKYLDFIISFVTDNGYSPTIKEIATGTSKPLGAAQFMVSQLKNKGYLVSTKEYNARNFTLAGGTGIPKLKGAIAYKVKVAQPVMGKLVPAGSFLIEKDGLRIGCWIPEAVFGGFDEG